MKFGFCGISYKSAGLDIRDKVSFTDGKKEDLFKSFEKIGINQAMVLSTCNRSEIYFFYESGRQYALAVEAFKNSFPLVNLEKVLNKYCEEEALKYLFRVSAGIESQVVGEDQILGQVRDAYEFSRVMGYSRKELNRVVTDAVACAKKIKAELKISEIPLSVSYVGIKKLNSVCGIKGKCVLIIGSGQTAELALKYAANYNPKSITVCSRTLENAEKLKKELPNIYTAKFDERYKALEESDIVISATASPHLIISSERFSISHNICFLDLASPRDIDERLSNNAMCRLINLDMLNRETDENLHERELLAKKGEVFINERVKKTIDWLNRTSVDEAIGTLQSRCEEIAKESINYINRKLTLNEHERLVIERTVRASLKRLLKEPINELKGLKTEEEREEYNKAIIKLFSLKS